MASKRDRHTALLDIIVNGTITSQSEIALGLAAKGFNLTQASISRDLEELGIVKANGRYLRPERPTAVPTYGQVQLIPAGSNLIVGRCLPGLASAITVRIDAAAFPEIIGTLAGDDTIFIAVVDEHSQTSVLRKITELFAI